MKCVIILDYYFNKVSCIFCLFLLQCNVLECFVNDKMQGMWKKTLAASKYEAPFWCLRWVTNKYLVMIAEFRAQY